MSTEATRLLVLFRDRGLLDVLDAIVAAHGVPREAILGRCRLGSIAHARQALYRELRVMGLSYPEIGKLTGRDHTTVHAACKGLASPARLITRAERRARCAVCCRLYEDHMAKAPHALVRAGCAGFVRLEFQEAVPA